MRSFAACSEEIGLCDMSAQGVQTREVECRANTCPECRGKCATPELPQWVWTSGDGAEYNSQGGRRGLLHAGFEEIGRLKETGGEDPRAKTGCEVESCAD